MHKSCKRLVPSSNWVRTSDSASPS